MNNLQLHEKLKKARIEADLSVVEASEKAGIGNNTIYAAESEGSKPKQSTLKALALAYGLPVDYFLREPSDQDRVEATITVELPDHWSREKKLRALKMFRELAQNVVKLMKEEEE